jgi:hypothetical protein
MASKGLRRFVRVAVAGAAFTVLLGGISSAQEPTTKEKKLELNFDLTKCEPMGPNLYKCPAVDKPICTTEFSQPDVVCIRVGKKGNVFVMMPGGASP